MLYCKVVFPSVVPFNYSALPILRIWSLSIAGNSAGVERLVFPEGAMLVKQSHCMNLEACIRFLYHAYDVKFETFLIRTTDASAMMKDVSFELVFLDRKNVCVN
uniref:Uncharacterized protein n=1 Tax=Micrurus lemniscatus lemniscatus TaxID=129467 RepID=A0A2D4HMT0_MICLE